MLLYDCCTKFQMESTRSLAFTISVWWKFYRNTLDGLKLKGRHQPWEILSLAFFVVGFFVTKTAIKPLLQGKGIDDGHCLILIVPPSILTIQSSIPPSTTVIKLRNRTGRCNESTGGCSQSHSNVSYINQASYAFQQHRSINQTSYAFQ